MYLLLQLLLRLLLLLLLMIILLLCLLIFISLLLLLVIDCLWIFLLPLSIIFCIVNTGISVDIIVVAIVLASKTMFTIIFGDGVMFLLSAIVIESSVVLCVYIYYCNTQPFTIIIFTIIIIYYDLCSYYCFY